MSLRKGDLPAPYRAAYAEIIEQALPGVRCLEFEASCDDDGETRWGVMLSAPEATLIGYGLIDPAVLASLPPCGIGKRGDVRISRGRTRTRLCGYWRDWRARRQAKDDGEASRNLEARILAAIVPQVWSPKAPTAAS